MFVTNLRCISHLRSSSSWKIEGSELGFYSPQTGVSEINLHTASIGKIRENASVMLKPLTQAGLEI